MENTIDAHLDLGDLLRLIGKDVTECDGDAVHDAKVSELRNKTPKGEFDEAFVNRTFSCYPEEC